jgi:hypothetical protein
LGVTVAREAGFWSTIFFVEKMTAKVSVGLAARLGLGAVIKSSGLASGSVTLGSGILAGFALDSAVDRLIRSFYDPATDLALQTDDAISDMVQNLLHGEKDHPGLLYEFDEYSHDRLAAWKVILKYQWHGLPFPKF